jgi:isopentenyl-diphosphate delta-isomerase
MTEIVDVVDENDNVISQEPLHTCLELGLLHRAVGVILLNHLGELFIQRRSLKDDYFPGNWTLSCTGHVRAGASCINAATRELREELGLKHLKPEFVLKHKVPKIRYDDRIENEIMYIYEYDGVTEEIVLDPIEVAEGMYVPINKLKMDIEDHKTNFTPDAIASFDKYFDAKKL